MAGPSTRRLRDFFDELKRRKVYRVSAIYIVLVIGGLELLSILLPATRLPPWFDELFLGLAIIGLPLVVVLSWTFDITENGIKKTGEELKPAEKDAAPDSPGPVTSASLSNLDPLALAVLPFENLSGSTSAEPFALGLHDDLLIELSRASVLTVISRTSVKGYRGSNKPIRQIASELNVGTIIEGGVQQSGNRVRLNVQIINAKTEGQIWAERYDRELTTENIFDLQSELAGRIMSELQARLTREEAAHSRVRPTEDLEAYRLLATGRHALIDRSEDGFRAAANLFERAIARDSEYALAWAGLGDALIGLFDYGHVSSDDVLKQGESACRRALEIDPNLAESHASLGRLQSASRDLQSSIVAHNRAIELRPNYAGPYQWLCWNHLLGHNEKLALVFGKKAVRLDPLDPEASVNYAVALLATVSAEAALLEVERILTRHPSFEYGLWLKALCLLSLGRTGEGNDFLARLCDRWTQGWSEVGAALEVIGNDESSKARLSLEMLTGEQLPFKAGIVHALLGDFDAAFEAMESEWPLPWDESLFLYYFSASPMDQLRLDNRYAALVAGTLKSWGADAIS